MVQVHKLLRVFWPQDVSQSAARGVVVGWKNSELDVLVVAVLEDVEVCGSPLEHNAATESSKVRRAESALRANILFRSSPHPMARMFQLCGKPSMDVLGTLNKKSEASMFDPWNLEFRFEPGARFPLVYCPREGGLAVQMIVYQKPSPVRMQYMSLRPISLALVDKAFPNSPRRSDADYETQMELIQKMRLHTVIKHSPLAQELLLPVILGQINCALELTQLLSKNAHLIGSRRRRQMSVSEIVVESASNAWVWILTIIWNYWTLWVYPIILRAFKIGLISHRIIAEGILRVLEWRLNDESAALKDVSDTAQQVDIRLQQFCYWPIQYTTLLKRKRDWDSVTDSHPDYIRFYNSLWLVANDVIIGIALGSYIIDNADWVAALINNVLSEWTVSGLRGMIEWLTDWPAGLKLNNELASFLADLVIWVIEYWSCMICRDPWTFQQLTTTDCVDGIRPLLPHFIRFIGFSGFSGATLPIALSSDLLSLFTIHVYSFYVASARIFHWQLTIIVSLFHLFRGKRHNVLRNRIDSCDYDLDQLLLGTILFTVLTFLLPTVLVFYLTFALSRMTIITLKAILDTLLAFLNHFPLFALMLRVKDPWRLPGTSMPVSCPRHKLKPPRWHMLRATRYSFGYIEADER